LGQKETVSIPAAFFVDPLLSGPQPAIEVPLPVYREALRRAGSSFAADETPGLVESDHAFLVPTRSRLDHLRVESLLRRGKLDRATMRGLLSVDFTSPIFSPARLTMMTEIPETWEKPSQLTDGLELSAPIEDNRIASYLDSQRRRAGDPEAILDWLRLADQRRHEIQAAQTSTNPRGAILEGGLGKEGFRRIFPAYSNFVTSPGQWMLEPKDGGLVPASRSLKSTAGNPSTDLNLR
jgi:hypothetical protein